MAGRARGNFSSPSAAFPLSSGQTAGSLTGGGVGEGHGNLTGESSYPSQPVVWNSDSGEELKTIVGKDEGRESRAHSSGEVVFRDGCRPSSVTTLRSPVLLPTSPHPLLLSKLSEFTHTSVYR